MDIVQIFIAADRYHICVEAFTVRKTVFFQSVAFPFRKGVYDLGVAAFDSLDIKAYRAFYTVKVVIKAGFRCYKCWSGYSEKIKLLGECLLEEIFYCFDRNLCVMEVQVCMIGCGDCDCVHYRFLLMIFWLVALWGIIAENGQGGNIRRCEVRSRTREKYWVLRA